jgi:hypothetical protein
MVNNNSVSKILTDVFFGTDQSKYAAIAIFITIAILCFFILFSSTDITVGERFIIIFFILLTAVPSILFSLFELTCIVTGGNRNARWWCYWLAWFISIIIILYCLLIIISMFFSMASYDVAMTRINENDEVKKISSREANDYAKKIMIANTDNYENALPSSTSSTTSASSTSTKDSDMVMVLKPENFQAAELPQNQVHVSTQNQVQKMTNMAPTANSLDNMGYDVNDNYSSLSGFANGPMPGQQQSKFMNGPIPGQQQSNFMNGPMPGPMPGQQQSNFMNGPMPGPMLGQQQSNFMNGPMPGPMPGQQQSNFMNGPMPGPMPGQQQSNFMNGPMPGQQQQSNFKNGPEPFSLQNDIGNLVSAVGNNFGL